MQTKTIKIRKKYVFGFFFFVIAAITIFMLINAFTEMNKAAPEPVEDYDNIELIQFEPVGDGAQVALISTDVGDMKAVLYPDEAPNAVSLFVSTAESGGYNGLTAGLYEQKSVFTLDAPEIDGTYKAELHKNLWPFKGALCMTDGGDIVFINTVQYTDEDKKYLSAEEGEMPEVRHAFYEHGGVPNYAGQYAVFGQVFEGIDVLEKIADSEMGTEIMVKSVEILTDSE